MNSSRNLNGCPWQRKKIKKKTMNFKDDASFCYSTLHTFRTPQGGPRNSDFLRTAPTKTKIFCAVYDYPAKEELSK